MADNELLENFLADVKIENPELTTKSEKIAELTEKLNAREEEKEKKRVEVIEETETHGLFPAPNNNLQPNRDKCKGRLLTGLGARMGGFQPRPGDLRRAYLKITPEQETRLAAARKFAMEQNLQYVMIRQKEEQNKLKRDPLANSTLRNQVIALMSRVYVAGVTFDIKEDSIRSTFGTYGVIRKVEFSWETPNMMHRGFAFIEFETPDMAQLALTTCIAPQIQGCTVKVGRPNNMPQAAPFIDVMIAEANKYPRIFVSNIHRELPYEDLESLFATFGKISSVEMPLDPLEGKHKGYAYITYAEHRDAAAAIAGLNRFDIGGSLLRVGKAITLPPEATKKSALPTATAVAAAAVAAKIKAEQGYIESFDKKKQPVVESSMNKSMSVVSESSINTSVKQDESVKTPAEPVVIDPQVYEGTKFADKVDKSEDVVNKQPEPETKDEKPETSAVNESLASEETVSIKGSDQRFIMMKKLAALRKQKDNVIVMRNMVDPDDIDDSLEDDIRSECVKFGTINNVVIKKIMQTELNKEVVKIFVEYENENEAIQAKNSLSGRFFGGKIIIVESYDPMKFKYGDYTG